jgi:hypothetical protein
MRGLFACLVLAGGCFGGGSIDLGPVEVALRVASSLGHAASIGSRAIAGPVACGSVTRSCDTFPCDGEVAIALGSACPLPIGGDGAGTVVVGGTFQSAEAATLVAQFVGVSAGGNSISVGQAAGIAVNRGSGPVSVAYTGQDVTVSDGHTLTAQSAWSIDIDERGTLEDPSDDVYTVTGSDQGAGTGGSHVSGGQLTITNVMFDPGCRLNPVGGEALIEEAGTSVLRLDTVRFHAACDGKADVVPALGGTRSVTLRFFD